MLTGVRLEIEGEKITMAATDRYRLAVRDLAWTPEQTGLSAIALVPARTLADTAKALASADKVTVALAGGAGEGLVGFEGSGRRTTSRLLDGEFPKYRSLLPAESASVATVETAGLVESVRRVALVAERNTPIRLSFSGGEVTLEAGSGDEAQASESLDAGLDRRRHLDRVQPGVPARRSRRAGRGVRRDAVHRADPAGRHRGQGQRRLDRGRRLPLPADAGAVVRLTRAYTRTAPRAHDCRRHTSMEIGLVGLGKMGGNMRERLRRAGHTVVGFDPNQDVSDSATLEATARAAARAAGGLGDGAGR